MNLKKLIKILIFGVILIPIVLVMYFINSFIFHEKGEVLNLLLLRNIIII